MSTFFKSNVLNQDTSFAAIALVPNSFGTVTNATYFGRRIADSLQCRGVFRAGTCAAAIASISLPAGYVIDSTKFSALANQSVGKYQKILAAVGPNVIIGGDAGVLFYDGSDTAKLYFASNDGSNVYTKVNANSLTGATTDQNFEFTVPIVGWGI